MNENGGELPSRNGAILPPVITRRNGYRLPALSQPAPIAPPFVAGSKPRSVETPAVQRVADEPPAEIPAATEPVVQAAAKPEEPEDMTWDPMSDEGVVEPAFKADTEAVLEELSQQAQLPHREEFPLEAFIVPEQTQRVPNGMEGKPLPAAPVVTALTSLAERLEKLSHKLRVEDTDEVVRRLAAGDRLDTLLAGLVAGYLAGSSDNQT